MKCNYNRPWTLEGYSCITEIGGEEVDIAYWPHLQIEVLPHGFEELPMYATLGSAGMDLRAAIKTQKVLLPKETFKTPTGLKMAIPAGMEGHIRPEGWHNWRNEANEATARYAEYRTTGPGANPKARVAWSHQLTDEQLQEYTLKNIFAGWSP